MDKVKSIRTIVYQGVQAGLVGGLVLGFLFKWIQAQTGVGVYTILLNIDFTPGIGKFNIPETIEFSLHMFVSILLGIVLAWVTVYLKAISKKNVVVFQVIVNGLLSVILFHLTLLSDRTPAYTDGLAWMYWILGHLIFGLVVGLLYRVGLWRK